MTRDDFKARCLDNLPGGPAQFITIVLLIIGIIVSAAISWLTEQWLNRHCGDKMLAAAVRQPGAIGLRVLDMAIDHGCRVAAKHPDVIKVGYTLDMIRRDYAPHARAAMLRVGTRLTDEEIGELAA